MRLVKWQIECRTFVDVDDDAEALEEVNQLFEGALWGEAGQCLSTMQVASFDSDVVTPQPVTNGGVTIPLHTLGDIISGGPDQCH